MNIHTYPYTCLEDIYAYLYTHIIAHSAHTHTDAYNTLILIIMYRHTHIPVHSTLILLYTSVCTGKHITTYTYIHTYPYNCL